MSCVRTALIGLFVFGSTVAAGSAMAATATIKSPEDKTLGTVTLIETPHGVLLDVDLKGLPPGGHGFHIHEKGACSPDFKAAGGHYNPANAGHGINHPKGSHAGDMPNIIAVENGRVRAEVLNAKVTLGAGRNSIFDGDGSAIVIHAKPDTHGANPGAGGRIGRGVITK